MNSPQFDGNKIRSLSIVIPAYNEEGIIQESLVALDNTIAGVCRDYEIIVVDDGSTDRTKEILVRLSQRLKNLKTIHHAFNRGLGAALRNGFSAASKNIIFYIDADMPFDYREILKSVTILETTDSDLVVGYRANRISESRTRHFCSKAYNRLVKIVFSIDISDVNCAFKLIKRSALEQLELKATGSFIDTELLTKSLYLHRRIKEMPVTYYPRQYGGSRLFKLHIVFYSLFEMFKYHREIMRLKK